MSKELKDIILPDLGEGIDGAEVSEISVSIGDTVKEGDTIVVLESDKASSADLDGRSHGHVWSDLEISPGGFFSKGPISGPRCLHH